MIHVFTNIRRLLHAARVLSRHDALLPGQRDVVEVLVAQ